MKFFSKINTRLWITYVLLIGFVLVAALTGIVVAFRNSPLLYWKEFVRLNYVTNSLANRLEFYKDVNWSGTIDLFLKNANLLDVRVIIIDNHGNILLDSAGRENLPMPAVADPSSAYQRTEGGIRLFRDGEKQAWFYQINPINDNNYLVSVIPRPAIRIRTLFQDELLNPLFRVGLIAMVIAFILSWFVARWITQPLQTISQSARQLAFGEFPPIKLEGPAEVQLLASVINSMDQQVRDSIQSQKDFVANVSHEFKTPLTSIQGFAQAIFDEVVQTQDQRQHAAQVILEETDRLNYLVNDLLTLAKLDAGTIRFDMRDISLNPILKKIIEKFEYRIASKGITVDLDLSEEYSVHGDGERITQVFNNLVDNAVKFTPVNGKIKISVSGDKRYSVISVHDNGGGIAEEDISKVFERFYQVDKSRGRNETRSIGLGLSIAHHIVRAHGGEISVQSELGVGSCFMVKIPIAHAKSK